METEDFRTVGDWYRKMKAEGYTVPLTLYYTLEKMIKDKKITFAQAYDELSSKNRIQISNKNVIFNLNEKNDAEVETHR